MKIIKSLNNNMILVRDDQGNVRICQGKGIGFHRRQGEIVDEKTIERYFIPANEKESIHFQQLFSQIPEEFWGLAEDVVEYGKSRYSINVSSKIILPLCDHMAGSVERYQKGVQLENPILWDIKRIYPKEFQIGKYALKLLEERFQIVMKEDEAAFLALHFVNAQLDQQSASTTNKMTTLIKNIIDIIEQSFQITLDDSDWNYQRFITHLKFFVNRIVKQQSAEQNTEDNLLYQELKERYPHAYRCVERIADYILIDYHFDIQQEERLYLLIHVERLTRNCG